jgi:hypothetical protein
MDGCEVRGVGFLVGVAAAGAGSVTDQVAVENGVALDHAFAGQCDVFGSEDGGAAGDFVAGFLYSRGFGLGKGACGLEKAIV